MFAHAFFVIVYGLCWIWPQAVLSPTFLRLVRWVYLRGTHEFMIHATPTGGAWSELIPLLKRDLARLGITVVPQAENPYPDARSMVPDLFGTAREIKVWTGECDHPVWSAEDNVVFRAHHDAVGHVGFAESCGLQSLLFDPAPVLEFDAVSEVRALHRQVESLKSLGYRLRPRHYAALACDLVGQGSSPWLGLDFAPQRAGWKW